MVKRELWLKKIRPFYENELIKVLIGIRRSGKSTLLFNIFYTVGTGKVSIKIITRASNILLMATVSMLLYSRKATKNAK